MKESGEEEYFGSTDEPQESNLIMPNNPFIDQDMNCEMTNKNNETSETSKVTYKKLEIFICQSSTCFKCVLDEFDSTSRNTLSDRMI